MLYGIRAFFHTRAIGVKLFVVIYLGNPLSLLQAVLYRPSSD